MKKILNIAAVAMVLAATSLTAHAQKGEVKFNLNYNYSMPIGNFNSNVLSNGSPRGGNGEVMFGFSNTFSGGFSIDYQDYYQKFARATYATGTNEATSAVLSNSIQAVPIMAKVTYSPLGNRGAVQPYLTGGAGIDILSVKQYLGEFGSGDNGSSFIAQAGAGVFVPFGKLSSAGLRLGANFDYVPYNKSGFGNLNTVDFQAGVYFPIR